MTLFFILYVPDSSVYSWSRKRAPRGLFGQQETKTTNFSFRVLPNSTHWDSKTFSKTISMLELILAGKKTYSSAIVSPWFTFPKESMHCCQKIVFYIKISVRQGFSYSHNRINGCCLQKGLKAIESDLINPDSFFNRTDLQFNEVLLSWLVAFERIAQNFVCSSFNLFLTKFFTSLNSLFVSLLDFFPFVEEKIILGDEILQL